MINGLKDISPILLSYYVLEIDSKSSLPGLPILNLSYNPFTKKKKQDLQKANSLEGLNEAAALLPKIYSVGDFAGVVIKLLFGCKQQSEASCR